MSTDTSIQKSAIESYPAPSSDVLKKIRAVELPPTVNRVIDGYEEIGGTRPPFLWKWIYSLFDAFTLSSVPDALFDDVRNQKTKFTIFVTLIDDIIEKEGNRELFSRARHIPFRSSPGQPLESDTEVMEVYEFASSIWEGLEGELRSAPEYEELSSIFEFDLRQAFNAMEYTRLVNDNLTMANLEGARHYAPHNMVLFPYIDIDLMNSPSFETTDLAPLRSITWDLQKLARIGNWVTTWERELTEGEFTAGIVIKAIRQNVVEIEELMEVTNESVNDITARIRESGLPDKFMGKWLNGYHEVKDHGLNTASVDLDAFVDGMETVMEYHLASQGLK